MPQTNQLRRAKKPFGKPRRNYVQSAQKVASTAARALSIARHIYGVINAEKKFHDATVSSTFDYTGAVNCLSLVPGGSGESQRNGNSIFVKGLSIRGNSYMNTTAASVSLRIMVIQDLSPNPGTLTTADVLQTVGGSYAPFSPLNDDNRRRFKVLTTKLVVMNNTGQQALPLKTYIPLKTHCRWNSSTSTDLNKGHIYTLIISDEPTNPPGVQFYSRLYYYDN